MRTHLTTGPIAIEVSATSLRMMQLDHSRGRPLITAVIHRHIPSHFTQAQRDHCVHESIAQAIKNGGLRGRKVVMAIQPNQFEIKTMRLPRIPREELTSAVEFEAEERFAFGEEGGQYRFVSAGDVRQGNETKEELIIFGARASTIDHMLSELTSQHLQPEAIDASPCAMARSFTRFLRRDEDSESVNVFVDVGYSCSTLVITRGANVVFVKVFDIGGRRFDEVVASRLGVSAEEANELRRGRMQGNTREADGETPASEAGAAAEQMDAAIAGPIEQLAREVMLCLRYYAVTFRGNRPSSLTLVGGEAHYPLLLTHFGQQTDVPCMVGDPLRGMGIASNAGRLGPPSLRPSWCTVVGLALRGSPWVAEAPVSEKATAAAV